MGGDDLPVGGRPRPFRFHAGEVLRAKSRRHELRGLLRKALDEGYKAPVKELADHAFDAVRNDPDVKTALELMQPPPEKSASSNPPGV